MSDSLSAIADFFSNHAEETAICVGDPNALERFYAELKKDFNLDELKDILDCEDNMLIVSGAGSGKTTTLLLKILRDILSGKLLKEVVVNGQVQKVQAEVLVSTFLKSGAEELLREFTKKIAKYNIKGVNLNKIHFRTIHSEVYNALTAMGVSINIVPEADTYKYIKMACKSYNVHSVMGGKSKELTKDEVADIACILTYARNRLDKSRYDHPLMNEYNITEIELKGIMEQFKQLKQIAQVQDFEDLEEQLYDAYDKYPKVVEYLKSRYDYIYVDEFQDTSQLQYAILEPYFKSAKGILCIGDDDQVIYSWRGSDASLIQERFEKDYHPTVKQLSVNRRCKDNILKAVVPSIEKNVNRHAKTLKASQKGGKIQVVVDGGPGYLMECVNKDLSESKRVGILGRTNADLLIPALLLELDGYSSFSLSKSVSLSDRIPSQVLGVMELITQRYNEKFESYFKLFLSKSNGYQATKLCEILSTTAEYSIYNLSLEDIQYSAPDLFSLIRMLRSEVKTNPVHAYVSLLEIMEQDVYNGTTIYAQRARDFTYYMRKIILEHEKLKNLTIDELYLLFTKTIADNLESKKPKLAKSKNRDLFELDRSKKEEPYVRITTVHDAKGKQWDSVYIWNDVNGCFPNSVGNRPLTKDEFEEERRVHYIAWTRAVDKLTVFTRSNRLNGFLSECDLSNAEIFEMADNKKLAADKMSNSTKDLVKKSVKNPIPIKKADTSDKYVTAIKDYVSKYTRYNYICTPKGSNLDICLVKLGGLPNLIAKLKEYHLEKYPDDMLEDTISTILEDLVSKFD